MGSGSAGEMVDGFVLVKRAAGMGYMETGSNDLRDDESFEAKEISRASDWEAMARVLSVSLWTTFLFLRAPRLRRLWIEVDLEAVSSSSSPSSCTTESSSRSSTAEGIWAEMDGWRDEGRWEIGIEMESR